METRASDVGVLEPAQSDRTSYIDWPPIFAGTAIATAITVVLTGFGSAIGLSLVSPFEGSGLSGTGLAIATGLWVIWVALSSLMAGSYLTGRMRKAAHDARPQEVALRDGTHGLVVWAVSILIGTVIAAGGVASAGRAAGDLAKTGIEAAGSAAGMATEYSVDELTRNQAVNVPIDADTRARIGRIVVKAGAEGDLSPPDRAYLVNTLAASAGITPAEAEGRIASMLSRANQALEEAKVAADRARRTAILVAFLTAASLAIAAAASWWAASIGGKHRDENTDTEHLFRW
jgi:hypothetical protein